MSTEVRFIIEGRRPPEGNWITFDDADSQNQGLDRRDQWQEARPEMQFRLIRMTTTMDILIETIE